MKRKALTLAFIAFLSFTGLNMFADTVSCETCDSTCNKPLVVQAYDKVAEGTVNTYNKVAEGTNEAYNQTKETVTNLSDTIANGTVQTYNNVAEGTVNVYNKAAEGTNKAYNATKEGVKNAVDKTKEEFNKIF